MEKKEVDKPKPKGVPNFTSTIKKFEDDRTRRGFNALILGEPGDGKTWGFRYAPKPVWIDVFDPDGAESLSDVIGMENGIFADTRWQDDDYANPKVYLQWQNEMKIRMRKDPETGLNWFDHIGTYIMDSSSMWLEYIAYLVMKQAGIPGGDPQELSKSDSYKRGWGPIKKGVKKGISDIIGQNCNFILTGHLKPVKNKQGEIVKYEYRTVGDLAQYIPAQFMEIWIIEARPDGTKGVKTEAILTAAGMKKARSRLATGGKLNAREPYNITDILNKAGFPTNEKPWK